MPEELKKYFWDTQFEQLDITKNKRYIISRLYCYGDLKAMKWVRENYTNIDIEYDWNKIKEFFINLQPKFQDSIEKYVI